MNDDNDNQASADQPTDAIDPLTVGELISLQDAAAYAGLNKGSLYNYILRGRLRAKRLGSQWITTRAAVDEYLQSRSAENIPKKYRNDS